MENIIWTIVVVVGIGGMVAFAIWFNKRKKEKAAEATIGNLPVKLPRSWTHTYDRPDLPYIQSNVPIPEEALLKISEGIQNCITATNARYGWTANPRPFDFNVAFIDPDATNRDGSPALIIHGIQSAGTCIGVGGDGYYPPVIVLPHHGATNWEHLDYLMRSSWHESEHCREWVCDAAVFRQYLGANDIHPHTPLPGAAVGLASRKSEPCGLQSAFPVGRG